jgi:hypothetical protein
MVLFTIVNSSFSLWSWLSCEQLAGRGKHKKYFISQVAHACNPSYSGGRDQGDHGSKLPQANSLKDPSLKKTHHRKGLAEWLKAWTLSLNPSTKKKKKKKLPHRLVG